jgi:predicted amidophosphoribosyltransferase
MMGEIIARAAARPDADFLVPVPLRKGSRRGYNQAELIARGASRVWGIPVNDCLRWNRRLPNQARMKSARERALAPGAIGSDKNLRGARVVLVDDVCTTGNTLRAARDAVLAAGAAHAEAAVWSGSVRGL